MNVLSIKASDIENWTNREPRRAQELLPKLLWKLILASSNNIEDHHFRLRMLYNTMGMMDL